MNVVWRALAGALLAFAVAASIGAQERYREEAVKAAFLYRFAGYIDWPDAALAGSHFTIAVLGSEEITRELERLLPNRMIKQLPARVRRIERLRELGDAQMLYVAAHRASDIRAIVKELGSKPVLVVTDHPRGLDAGGAVNFISLDRRVRFEISVPAATRAQLKVGGELLSVAARVRGAPERADSSCADDVHCGCAQDATCTEQLASSCRAWKKIAGMPLPRAALPGARTECSPRIARYAASCWESYCSRRLSRCSYRMQRCSRTI
jgi:hypothetical protein